MRTDTSPPPARSRSPWQTPRVERLRAPEAGDLYTPAKVDGVFSTS